MVAELKAFLMRGNVIDLAVAVVIGAAFTAIVTAFVEGIINPLIGLIVGRPSFDTLTFTIRDSEFRYGAVLTTAINFILVGLVLFFVVKGYNTLEQRRRSGDVEPEAPAPDPEDILLLREIRDALTTRGETGRSSTPSS